MRESSLQPEARSAILPSRFAWILNGLAYGPERAIDVDLAQDPDVAIVPTLGALVPEWLLVVPRRRSLSIAAMAAAERARIDATALKVLAEIASRTRDAVTFEHGPCAQKSALGCGVDQAHLHVVGHPDLSLDALLNRVREVTWMTASKGDPWSSVPVGREYLLARDAERAYVALTDNPSSQRLRRAVAEILRRDSEWDYRAHPNAENARRTTEIFRSTFVDAGS